MRKFIAICGTLLLAAGIVFPVQAAPLTIDSNSIAQIGFIDNTGISVENAALTYDFSFATESAPLTAQVSASYLLENPGVSEAVTDLVIPFYTTLSHYYSSPFSAGSSRADALAGELLGSTVYSQVNDSFQAMDGPELLSALQSQEISLFENAAGTLYRISSDGLDTDSSSQETALTIQNLTAKSQLFYLDYSGVSQENGKYFFQLQLSGVPDYAYVFVTGTEGVDYDAVYSQDAGIHIASSPMRLSSYLTAYSEWYLEMLYPELDSDSSALLLPSLISYVNLKMDQSQSINLITALDWCMNQPLLLLNHLTLRLKPQETVQLQLRYPTVFPTVILEDQTVKYRLLNHMMESWPDTEEINLELILPDFLKLADTGSSVFQERKDKSLATVFSSEQTDDFYFSLKTDKNAGAPGWNYLLVLGGCVLVLGGGAAILTLFNRRSKKSPLSE
ncbi:hypothetical protein [Cuneatibacter caecimuris]|uniref:LPXTG-motif cell wall-anchored protein n=1 Tax=Cuneatibacter caecimuris TaxID=1796618 RepID=A0A4Q7NZH9_9FIRM|nr:hypothetical protein [Cuneatibacter caecimuris]RZS92785.1 hypothetical protein EV209_2856 [Cuneatibacter caecimuris]